MRFGVNFSMSGDFFIPKSWGFKELREQDDDLSDLCDCCGKIENSGNNPQLPPNPSVVI